MFLAYVFPFSERSGVNSSGTFNVANVTPFELDAAATSAAGGDVDVDSTAAPTDFGLYRTFWSVQELLSNPQKILASKDGWIAFVSAVSAVVRSFDGQGVVMDGDVEEGEEAVVPDVTTVASVVVPPAAGAEDDVDTALHTTETTSVTPAVIEEFYCTKYLTNSQLFNLQVCAVCCASWLWPMQYDGMVSLCCVAVARPHTAPPHISSVSYHNPIAFKRPQGTVWDRCDCHYASHGY